MALVGEVLFVLEDLFLRWFIFLVGSFVGVFVFFYVGFFMGLFGFIISRMVGFEEVEVVRFFVIKI